MWAWWWWWSIKHERISKKGVTSVGECFPGLLLERPGGQEAPDNYAIALVEVGVGLVVEVVGETRFSKKCATSGGESLPGLVLGRPGEQETPDLSLGLAEQTDDGCEE